MSSACCSSSHLTRCAPASFQRQPRLSHNARLRQPIHAASASAAVLPSSSSCISQTHFLVPRKPLTQGGCGCNFMRRTACLYPRCSVPRDSKISCLWGAGQRNARCPTRMGKTAPDGVFTPIVIAAQKVLGQKRFNSIRGQGISLHSQGKYMCFHLLRRLHAVLAI